MGSPCGLPVPFGGSMGSSASGGWRWGSPNPALRVMTPTMGDPGSVFRHMWWERHFPVVPLPVSPMHSPESSLPKLLQKILDGLRTFLTWTLTPVGDDPTPRTSMADPVSLPSWRSPRILLPLLGSASAKQEGGQQGSASPTTWAGTLIQDHPW